MPVALRESNYLAYIYAFRSRRYKTTAIMNIWMKFCNLSLKSLHVLGGNYYLISPSEMDYFCQWIYDTRDRCFDDDITVEKLLSLNTDVNSLQIVMGDQIDSILYLPTGSEWQQEKCRLLGLSFIRSSYIKSKDSVRIGISQAPLATVRIKGDGNCFFSKPITSSNRVARLP